MPVDACRMSLTRDMLVASFHQQSLMERPLRMDVRPDRKPVITSFEPDQ